MSAALKLVEDDKILFSAIPAPMIPILWDDIEPFLLMALEHSNGELDIDILRERIMSQEMLVVLVNVGDVIKAALTVEIRNFDTGKNTMILTTGGGTDMHLWIDEFSQLADDLARDKNCDEIYIIGRPGWKKVLKDYGFGVCHTVLSRKVGDKI